jgi:hypothetical protein
MSTIPVVELNSISAPKRSTLKKWWTQDDTKEICHDVIAVARAVADHQRERANDNLMFARLYGNMELSALTAYDPTLFKTARPKNRVTLNVCKAAINTVVAKIAKNKPKPMFLTEEGDWDAQEKAKKLTQYVLGVFYAAQTYSQSQMAFTDACVFGSGAVKVFEENGQIKTERTLIDEIKVDEAEGIYGDPRSLFQIKRMQREMLLEAFPECKEEIEEAGKASDTDDSSADGVSDMIEIVEAWHLPSSDTAGDGRHVIAINGCTLFDEKWEKDYFPFAFIRWEPKTLGFYGGGICEELLGIQVEINKILKNVQDSMHLFAVPRVYMQQGSQITKSLNNQIGAQYTYQGSQPTFMTPPAMSRDVYEHLWNLFAKAFEIVGVSQLSATSKKPAGLDSGVAIREYNDIETERFVLAGQRYEDFHMQLARIIIDMTRDMMKKDGAKPTVKVKGGKWMQKIDWKDVDLDEDNYVMQVFPASLLPNTPAGRMQYVNDLQEKGWIDPTQAMSLLDFPDVKEFTSLQTAAMENAKRVIARMLNDGEYEPPDPLMDLQMTLRMTQNAYLKAKLDGAPQDKLDMLLQYVDDLAQTIQANLPEPSPMPEIPGMPPEMGGMPPGLPPGLPPGIAPPQGAPPPPAQLPMQQ